MAPVGSAALTALTKWKASLTPLRVDIVGDFAGKELFAIHGEALLCHCVTRAKVDFTDGFQLLHAVHAVETFLSKLRERGCNFHVLWFDSQEELAVPRCIPEKYRHKYLLTRAVLIEHLRSPETDHETTPDGSTEHHNGKDPMSFVFSAIGNDEFADYMEENSLHFVMCSQGRDAEDANGSIDHLLVMYLFAKMGYSLSFIDGLDFRSSKVYTQVVTPSNAFTSIQVSESATRHTQDLGCGQIPSALGRQTVPFSDHDFGTEIDARERIALVFCASILKTKPGTDTERRVAAFLVHIALLKLGELAQRSCRKPEAEVSNEDHSFLEDFSFVAITLIRRHVGSKAGASIDWHVYDLVDGRIFFHILQNIDSLKLVFDVRSYGKIIEGLVGINVLCHLPHDGHPVQLYQPVRRVITTSLQNHANAPVLPFSHPVLDPYLEDIKLDTDRKWQNSATGSKIFQELTHWHNAKKTVDPKHAIKPMDPKALRRNQRFMADTIAYSASLTNAAGKNIEPEIIIAQEPQKNGRDKMKSNAAKPQTWKADLARRDAAKVPKHNTKSGKAKALAAAKNIQVAKAESKSQAVVAFFAQQCQDFDKVKPLVQRYLKANKYLLTLSSTDREVIGGEALLYICKTLANVIGKPPFGALELNTVALLRAHVLEMYKLPLTVETRKQLKHLTSVLELPPPADDASRLIERPLPFIPAIQSAVKHLELPEYDTAGEFQLEHCGPYLERSFDSAPDPRVPFQPDAWQRKVLDAIDRNKSLFVVAPTSAGKTFISFYAMKKVLQANNDDVLVYVAPTKALVNQIAAEVQARFSKTYPNGGRSVWAIHTRDYRINNSSGCQVLVTVPHILQIMLLAPSNAKTPSSWSRRVKRIIFDEVHCIGQAEDGMIWEQLLLLAPCPIIALSATVGNPLAFKEWLAGTQKAKGFDLEMVVHGARYSDLRKFVYQPPKDRKFNGLDPVVRLPLPGLDAENSDDSQFVFIHPVGSIVNKRSKETLKDVSLEPRDCLNLWQTMSEYANDSFPVDHSINPKNALKEVIKKSDVLEWEVALKNQLYQWMADPNSPFADLHNHLATTSKPSTGIDNTVKATFPLLVDLRSRGALPAIIFNYDRIGCETILFEILENLETAEENYRQTDSEWNKKLQSFRKWREGQKSRKQAKSSRVSNGREDDDDGTTFSKMDQLVDDASQEASPWASFNPEAPIERFSFADSTKISTEELEKLISSLAYANIKKPIIEALRRGLGVHHAGMNRKYRQVVEMLFRKGFLTAVIATGTLALGLNMPCKTVVFTGDSVFLTALNYRQASGRAGRRGFDLLGNVVFHGIPHHRVMEIMSSRLPDLRGQFPMSVTLILRLFGLLHGTDGSDYAINAIQSLLTQTRLYLGGPSSQMSIKHHLRFSIEYLRRQHLLSSGGAPLNFSGLVGHLYFTENAAFAFHSLMKEGYLHELCEDVDNMDKQKYMLVELLKVLCHLFCRIPCPRYDDQAWLKEVVYRSPSVVLLPSLPEKAAATLRDHNRETLGIFQTYVRSFVEQHLSHTPDDVLPFTNRKVGPSRNQSIDISATNVQTLPPTTLRSPFAALSGFTDDFSTIHELCETVRAGVFLEEESIPYIPIYPDETGGVPFNAYILDFFKHGDMEALVRDNGIKRGDVWFHLKDFSLILATIVTSLANFLDKTGAEFDDAAMVDLQDVGDILEEEAVPDQDDDAHGSATVETAAKDPKIQPKVTKAPSKKVQDSWDDNDDSDEGSEIGINTNDGVGGTSTSWDEDEGAGLMKVYKVFKLLQQEFDEKFRKVWA
ncbi:DEAD/DEAH box helicase [Colletotrichum karsti]|uniref:DEAD/DEAH box helicase n=1 Tax=Colletotrichum karsti TaxID=1095194 RepID=A0A9P6HVI1_9PEZI|nr:DEAD/DEAH box helicase [Colletotrichum karsti]KAF9871134.1 DEAD/DEAH box helicase [Colletotrichum karsti]